MFVPSLRHTQNSESSASPATILWSGHEELLKLPYPDSETDLGGPNTGCRCSSQRRPEEPFSDVAQQFLEACDPPHACPLFIDNPTTSSRFRPYVWPMPPLRRDLGRAPTSASQGLALAFPTQTGAGSSLETSSTLVPRDTDHWTILQILIPVVVGVVSLLLAALFFYWYRRRRRMQSRDPPRRHWVDADLRAPRRFFGLLPGIKLVRPARARGQDWAIDEDSPGPYIQQPRVESLRSTATSHSRTDSSTSLLSRVENALPQLPPFLDSLSRYKDGVPKAPGYRAAKVKTKPVSPRFKIDESQPPTRTGTMEDAEAEAEVDAGGNSSSSTRVSTETVVQASRPFTQTLEMPANQDSDDEDVDEDVDEDGVLLISRVPGMDFSLESVSGHDHEASSVSSL